MGIYLNPSNILFREERYKEFYDMSSSIEKMEEIITEELYDDLIKSIM